MFIDNYRDLRVSLLGYYVVFTFKKNVGGAVHFIYYINRLTATKVDSTYLGCFSLLNQQYTAYMSVAGLERMTTGSAVSPYPIAPHRLYYLYIIYCFMKKIKSIGDHFRKNIKLIGDL